LAEIKTPESWARTYLLRPAVNPSQLTSVMILTPQRSVAGLVSVWANVGSVDSATRSIVAAGDSLARQSASQEAAARRASIDSAARLLNDSLHRDSTVRRDTSLTAAPAPPRDSSTAAAFRRDSIAAARVRRARRDSIAGRARADSVARPQRDSGRGVRP
jgi:rod shape-determining protein MreC